VNLCKVSDFDGKSRVCSLISYTEATSAKDTLEDTSEPVKLSDDQRIEAAIKRKITSPEFDTTSFRQGYATFYIAGSKQYVLPLVLCSSLEVGDAELPIPMISS
jgi:hypothetical protein